jgi:hypothetical protein
MDKEALGALVMLMSMMDYVRGRSLEVALRRLDLDEEEDRRQRGNGAGVV